MLGILGTISKRISLEWVRGSLEALPWLNCLFVGPVTEISTGQNDDLDWLRRHPRCYFVGHQNFDDLCTFAAAIDVALIPYNFSGINPTSSPVRLFTHLAYGSPILASPGCEQLDEFDPLVKVCPNLEVLVSELESLRMRGFDDGLRESRWIAARENTWERRAITLRQLIDSGPGARPAA